MSDPLPSPDDEVDVVVKMTREERDKVATTHGWGINGEGFVRACRAAQVSEAGGAGLTAGVLPDGHTRIDGTVYRVVFEVRGQPIPDAGRFPRPVDLYRLVPVSHPSPEEGDDE